MTETETLDKLIELVAPESREKARVFIALHGIEAFKKICTLEPFNFEEAWQAVKDCTNEELLLCRMLIKDSYGYSLQEIAAALKEVGAEKTRTAFFQLKKKGKRFNTADVFELAKTLPG